MAQQCGGGSLGEGAAGADGDEAVFGLDDIAIAGNDQGGILVGHCEQGFEPAQGTVGAPVLGQLYRGAYQMALVFLEFRLETLEQGEGISGAAGEPGNHLVAIQASHLAGVALHDGIAEGDLAVAADHYLAVSAH